LPSSAWARIGTLLAGALAAAGHPILACGRAPLASVTVTVDAGSTSYPVTWTDEPGDLYGVR
jgi:2-dehydropantoate 2-reductase